MREKVYINFFILCAILAQENFAKFLKEDVGESSKLLVREKRVINRIPGRETLLRNGDLPYVANLRKSNSPHCIVTILSQHTAITAAGCLVYDLRLYTVLSGSSYSHRGDEHKVTEEKKHGYNPSRPSTFQTGIALITVSPSFVFSLNTGSISLHTEPILAGMQGIVAGWGYRIGGGEIETRYTQRLRIIGVPIMKHRECQNIYRGHFPITEEDICTYHPQKLCANIDGGAPLVIDNQLAGIHIGEIHIPPNECPIKPDVFILLQHLNYGPWIRENIRH